jgi:hypothetical protein
VLALLAPAVLGILLTSDAAAVDREFAANRRSRQHASAAKNRAQRDSLALKKLPNRR